jgi:hypothetical protein
MVGNLIQWLSAINVKSAVHRRFVLHDITDAWGAFVTPIDSHSLLVIQIAGSILGFFNSLSRQARNVDLFKSLRVST